MRRTWGCMDCLFFVLICKNTVDIDVPPDYVDDHFVTRLLVESQLNISFRGPVASGLHLGRGFIRNLWFYSNDYYATRRDSLWKCGWPYRRRDTSSNSEDFSSISEIALLHVLPNQMNVLSSAVVVGRGTWELRRSVDHNDGHYIIGRGLGPVREPFAWPLDPFDLLVAVRKHRPAPTLFFLFTSSENANYRLFPIFFIILLPSFWLVTDRLCNLFIDFPSPAVPFVRRRLSFIAIGKMCVRGKKFSSV